RGLLSGVHAARGRSAWPPASIVWWLVRSRTQGDDRHQPVRLLDSQDRRGDARRREHDADDSGQYRRQAHRLPEPVSGSTACTSMSWLLWVAKQRARPHMVSFEPLMGYVRPA